MDKILFFTMLYDFYSELITKKQKDIFELYYLNDFSLNEVAAEFSITRQAVLDSIKRTEKSLLFYEQKLSLVSKYNSQKNIISNIQQILDDSLKNNLINSELTLSIKNNLSRLLD